MDSFFTQLAPELYLISGEQGGRFPYSNGLMVDGETRVLVDTGFGCSRRDAVLATGEVDVIINTHFHLDHTYGNRYFPKASVWAHGLDAPALRSSEIFTAYTGFGTIGDTPNEEFFPGGMESRQVARELSDGEILDFGAVTLQVVHAPGHTPGHIALFEPRQGILFSADIDLSSFGPWYGNLRSDIEQFACSIEKLIALEPKVLVTSHSGIVTQDIPHRLRQYADKLNQREEQILQHLRNPKTLSELVDVKIIFPRYPEPQKVYRFFERTMLEKHLQRLLRQGKVKQKSNQQFKACV